MRITIDGKELAARAGETILDVARRESIDIPTLCHSPDGGYMPSCGVCVVKVRLGSVSKLLPACDSRVQDGMDIETDSPDVREARKTALELLVSEHVGECLAPCETVCPAGIDIPAFLRRLRTGEYEEAHNVLLAATPSPAYLSVVCRRYCENACRRKALDRSVGIADLKIRVAQECRESTPERRPSLGKWVAVVGGGLTGLTAAYFLSVNGCEVAFFSKGEALDYHNLSPELRAVVDGEVRRVMNLVDERKTEAPDMTALCREFDAVIVSEGELESPAENLFAIEGNERTTPPLQTSRARHAAWEVLRYLGGEADAGDDLIQVRSVQYDKASLEAKKCEGSASGNGEGQGSGLYEAGRCLNCDCLKKSSCELRILATRFGVDVKKASIGKGTAEIDGSHPEVLFEPGKCIKCGRCISMNEIDKLAFAYRGYAVRVKPSVTGRMSDIGDIGKQCVKICPTGAFGERRREF